jgi:hypothetical protein
MCRNELSRDGGHSNRPGYVLVSLSEKDWVLKVSFCLLCLRSRTRSNIYVKNRLHHRYLDDLQCQHWPIDKVRIYSW